MAKLPDLKETVRRALQEDAAYHDVTTLALIPKNHFSQGVFLAKQDLVLCGLPVLKEVLRALDPRAKLKATAKEGDLIRKGKAFAKVSGRTRALLSGERVALNYLQHLSGVATLTRRFVHETRGTRAKILDTRKTIPGLRALEKYAVRVGGGVNHRSDLQSAAMIKDNHRALAASLATAVQRVRRAAGRIPLVVEVDTIAQLKEALALQIGHVLLDNMSVKQLREAVRAAKGRVLLEASGGINLKTARAVARTGVDYLSVGALTHSAPAADISFEILGL